MWYRQVMMRRMWWAILGGVVLCGLVLYVAHEAGSGKQETPRHLHVSDSVESPAGWGSPEVQKLLAMIERLRPLHTGLGRPQEGDWLEAFDEPGQTFREYLDCDPVRPQGRRRVIYIQPLGAFTESQRAVVGATADFLGRYFQLAVRLEDAWPESMVPASGRRRHPSWGMEQILTTHVLDELLLPQLPDDAAASLAFTATDLWPGEGWNFVFGQASVSDRVGVWSVYRNGDPDSSGDAFRLCLRRTLATASHEAGHMFSMLHCTQYECNMCGTNSLEESDLRPLALCPECVAKLCWATSCDPMTRYRELAEFCEEHGLSGDQAFYERSIRALTGM